MKTNNAFTEEFYKNLYDEIINNKDYETDNEEETTCEMEFEIGNLFVRLNATFKVEFVDDSFDHAFGTEHCYHYEVGDLEDIEIEEIYMQDEEGDFEIEVTDQFDEEKFWEQFKQYGVRNIKPGDEVIARRTGRYGREVTATYLYTDTMKDVHVCKYMGVTIEASWVRLPKPDESKKF